MNDQLLMIGCGAGALALGTFFVLRMLVGNRGDDKLRDRLTGKAANDRASDPPAARGNGAASARAMFQRIGQAAAQPFMPKTREAQSGMRETLGRAGIYNPAALKVLVGAKVIFLVLGVFAGHLLGVTREGIAGYLMCLSIGGLVGYLGPQFWLKTRVKGNQRALTYGLAGALDLMVVGVEGGLTGGAAMHRVGQGVGLGHPPPARGVGIAPMAAAGGPARA